MTDPAIPVGSSLYYYNRTVEVLAEERGSEWGDYDQGGDTAGTTVGADDFFRLFLVPNMGHCSGSAPDPRGDSPWYFGGGSQGAGNASVGPEVIGLGSTSGGGGGPYGEDGKVRRITVPGTEEEARVDAVLALVRWVEGASRDGGAAPGELVVRKFQNDNLTAAEVVRTGKVCSWPGVAKWDGTGDVRDESSWACGP